ncbi:MAG: beta-ketoacyl-ACP synthase 3 [Chitinispirillaceae bacterium]|nr:beta-ketoacyl-ACP synthase 3 [Chitinispirillaceae bacterium]
MSEKIIKTSLFLPAQAAAETEATILRWHVKEGDSFVKSQILAEAESAKSSFEFEAPCNGKVISILVPEGSTTPFDKPVIEIETDDKSMEKVLLPAGASVSNSSLEKGMDISIIEKLEENIDTKDIYLLGIGSYLPERIVKNEELLIEHPDINYEYIFGVTGIKERRWAAPGEKPSDMAAIAAKKAIERAGIKPEQIDCIIVSTATPEVVMPSTACLLEEKLGIRSVPAFDLNAACSGWIYALVVAKGLIASGFVHTVLVTAVEMQSRLLDKKDRNTYFLFGDGAGAAVISDKYKGHLLKSEILTADPAGIKMARREFPGYEVPENSTTFDPWIRLDGKALFRFATESFSTMIRELVIKSGWKPEEVRWVVPHQANSRILKAAATKSGVPFERFYVNIDRMGNTSSASIPIALAEIEKGLQKKDKIVLCTVGAGITAGGLSIEW